MSLLGFLKSSTVEEAKDTPKGKGGKSKQWNPVPSILAIRVWKDGSVFPSQALVDKFQLEYQKAKITKTLVPAKEVAGLSEEAKAAMEKPEPVYKNTYEYPDGTGNGFDVINSTEWGQFKGKEGQAMLFVAPVLKSEPKVDLFSTTNYEETGIPIMSVMDQGAVTFGTKVLLPAIEKVYGIKLTEEKEFVDMEVVEILENFNITEHFSKNIMFVPKVISRGEKQGQMDYERREGAKVYGFIPAELVNPEAYKKANTSVDAEDKK